MDFAFSPEQDALRAAVRAFIADRAPIAYVRSGLEQDRCGDEFWPELAALGWPGILVPKHAGGLGLGTVDLVVVMEELGRALFPGPFLSSAVLATAAARALELDALLSELAHGRLRAAVAFDDSGTGDPIDAGAVRASGRGSRYRLTGLAPLVIDAHTADVLIVPARTREALRSFVVDDFVAEPVATLDLTRKFARVAFDDTVARPVGPAGEHAELWDGVVRIGAIALAAELTGVSEAANQLAVDYARAREVFGKPLSKFQVTRHKVVDRLREVELARVGVHYAAWAVMMAAPDAGSAVAMAKSYSAEVANLAGAECIQVHGGLGFTWDCDAHLYLRRAKQNDLMLGGQGHYRRRLADAYLASL